MGIFVTRVNGFQLLTIDTKTFILGLAAVLDPPPCILSFFFDIIMDDIITYNISKYVICYQDDKEGTNLIHVGEKGLDTILDY